MPSIKSLKLILPIVWVGLAGCAQPDVAPPVVSAPAVTGPATVPVAPANPPAVAAEKLRTDCIAGRRLICGRVIKVLRDGLVVDSGYTDLLRPPLTESWLIPGTVSAKRNSASLELHQAGTPCFGLVFLTDTPKRPKPEVWDYVVIMGYPAGTYNYQPAPGLQKPIRKFAAGLDTAVKLRLQQPPAHS